MRLAAKRPGSRVVTTCPMPRPTRNSATTVTLLMARSAAKLRRLNQARR